MTLSNRVRRSVKLFGLFGARTFGLFALSRRLTKERLRILCYHGMSIDDEHRFRPKLFIDPAVFAKRMHWLRARGVRVVHLGEAVEGLKTGEPVVPGVAITIDDGWFGTYRHGLAILSEHNLPATVYVTTYYAEKATAVFNVLIPYLFWKSGAERIDLSAVDAQLSGVFRLNDPEERDAAIEALIRYGDGELPAEARQTLALATAQALGLDSHAIASARIMGLMTLEEVRNAAGKGFDIQLHTHRHRFPHHDEAQIEREITDNRRVLSDCVTSELVHFCYPSGVYDAKVFPCMQRLGIRTATTCVGGLNDRGTHPLALRRLMDGSDVTQIEFEALISGFYDMLRDAQTLLRSGGTRRQTCVSQD